MSPSYLSDAQLRAELLRCQSCETKPCRRGCPAGCSPADFIMAARCSEPSDYRRAAAHILAHNPLGGVCGSVCPDRLCMARCTRRGFDAPVNIPGIQAGIVRRARQLGVLPRFEPLPATGERVAVVGAGPAGLGAASVLAKAGHTVHVFDAAGEAGGMARLIPHERLDPEVLEADVAWLLGLGDVQLVLGERVELPRDLLQRGYAAVIVAAGLGEPVPLAAMMYGLGVVNELQGGLSFFLAERGLRSVPELVASAAAQTISPTGKAVCEVDLATCTGCGTCSRCPHLAIALDARDMPTVDRVRCVGCALCVQLCLNGSLSLHWPGLLEVSHA